MSNSKTLQELYSELPHKAIAEKAEDAFRSKQVSRRRFSERVMNLLPLQTMFAWLVAFILSAPHTAELFIRITPSVMLFGYNLVSLSPIVIELFIFVIAALNERHKGKYKGALWSMFALSVSVNIVGSLVSLWKYSATVGSSFSPFDYGFYLIAPFAGILVSYLGIVSGRILLQFASGETNLEIETGEGWRGMVKYYALKEAFYNAALKHGATPTRASNYAETQALEYCAGEIETSQEGQAYAVSRVSLPNAPIQGAMAYHGTNLGQVQNVQSVYAKSQDFGFAGMAKNNLGVKDSQNNKDAMESPNYPLPRMTSKLLEAWLDDNEDNWQDLAEGRTKREKSKALSLALTGNEKGYKTIERVFEERGIIL